MSKKRILIIEDEKDIAKLIRYNLEKAGFQCYSSESGEKGLELLGRETVEMVLLDIMLPGMDGLEVCRKIKQDRGLSNVSVVMLTAKGEEVDRIVGFELGADDYIVKPFSPRELILRVKAILKRFDLAEENNNSDILEHGNLKVDIPRHKVTVRKKEVVLTPMEFDLLVTLMSRAGRVQSREKLLNDVWDIASDVTTRTVDTHIKRLRNKLGRSGDAIETVRGLGYRFSEA